MKHPHVNLITQWLTDTSILFLRLDHTGKWVSVDVPYIIDNPFGEYKIKPRVILKWQWVCRCITTGKTFITQNYFACPEDMGKEFNLNNKSLCQIDSSQIAMDIC